MTIVGLHDFVKVSISAEFKSFLLIIYIDAPESTTNSRSSSLRVDAGRHLFSEGEKNVALSCSFLILTHFSTASTLLRRHLTLATLSLPEIDPQILERWGYADEVHQGKYISDRRIFVSNFSVTRNSLRELSTLDWSLQICALPENRLRRRHVLKYATQLPCVR